MALVFLWHCQYDFVEEKNYIGNNRCYCRSCVAPSVSVSTVRVPKPWSSGERGASAKTQSPLCIHFFGSVSLQNQSMLINLAKFTAHNIQSIIFSFMFAYGCQLESCLLCSSLVPVCSWQCLGFDGFETGVQFPRVCLEILARYGIEHVAVCELF